MLAQIEQNESITALAYFFFQFLSTLWWPCEWSCMCLRIWVQMNQTLYRYVLETRQQHSTKSTKIWNFTFCEIVCLPFVEQASKGNFSASRVIFKSTLSSWFVPAAFMLHERPQDSANMEAKWNFSILLTLHPVPKYRAIQDLCSCWHIYAL